ncbi:MAG TPA: hypothetical protein VFC07_08225 [Verrucomicrobiae bacterium]|nr:hypothetical protein [Verrucomicrobiae bacterium]
MNHLSFVISVCSILTVLSCLWLGFIVFFPKQWGVLVDKENAYWVGKGIISAARAEQIKRLEKGMAAKVMAGLLAVLTTFLLIFSVHTQSRINMHRTGPMLPPVRPRIAPPNKRAISILQTKVQV